MNDKLNTIQKSKLFYKEQWARIVREIHKLKMENRLAFDENLDLRGWVSVPLETQQRIITFNFRLSAFVDSTREELHADRDELNQLKRLLDEL